MKIYYHASPMLRKRQKETVENTPVGIDFESNQSQENGNVKDTDIFKLHKYSIKYKIIRLIKHFIPLLNIQKTKGIGLNDKLSYTWGKFILNRKYDYVIELDTPYVLTYYNVFFFRLLKSWLKLLLKRKNCKQIVCISEACKACLIAELGDKLKHKISVVYPWIAMQPDIVRSGNDNVKLLFISTQFSLKGGRELLVAFSHLQKISRGLTLTLITNLSDEEIAILPDGVKYYPANIDKAVLNREIYPAHNVFVLPSYQDSFGLVYLEALSHGLPILSTDRFAMPEMIINGVNGVTLKPPFQYYLDDFRANKKFWGVDLAKLTKEQEISEEYVKRLVVGLENCIDNIPKYAKRSREIFKGKFSQEARNASFKRMIFRCFDD